MDRNLTVEMNLNAGGNAANELRNMGKGLKDMERAEHDTAKAGREKVKVIQQEAAALKQIQSMQKDRLTFEEQVTKKVRDRIDAYRTEKRVKEELAKVPVEQGGTQQTRWGQMKGAFGKYGGLASAFGPMAAVLGAARLGNATFDSFERAHNSRGELAHGEFQRSILKKLESLPLTLGTFVRARNAAAGVDEPSRYLHDQQMLSQLHSVRVGAGGQRFSAEYGLRMEQAGFQSSMKREAAAMRERYGFSRQSAEEASLRLAGAGRMVGYGREVEEADILRQVGMERSMRSSDIDKQSRLAPIEAKLEQANKEEAQIREKVRATKEALEGEQRSLNDMLQRPQRSTRTSGGMFGMVGFSASYLGRKAFDLPEEGVSGEKEAARREAVARAQEASAAAQAKLEQVIADKKSLQIEKTMALLEHGKARVSVLQQEREALVGIVQSEKSRAQSQKESFGLLLPHQKEGLLNLSKKVRSGANLNAHELDLAKQHQDFFGDAIRKQGARMAGGEFDEIRRNLGLDRRQKEAEGQVGKMDVRIVNEINANAQSIAEQVQQNVVPQIQQALTLIASVFGTTIARETNQQAVQRAVQAKGQ